MLLSDPEVGRQMPPAGARLFDNLAVSRSRETHGFADRPRGRGALVEGEDGTVSFDCIGKSYQPDATGVPQAGGHRAGWWVVRPAEKGVSWAACSWMHEVWDPRHRTQPTAVRCVRDRGGGLAANAPRSYHLPSARPFFFPVGPMMRTLSLVPFLAPSLMTFAAKGDRATRMTLVQGGRRIEGAQD